MNFFMPTIMVGMTHSYLPNLDSYLPSNFWVFFRFDIILWVFRFLLVSCQMTRGLMTILKGNIKRGRPSCFAETVCAAQKDSLLSPSKVTLKVLLHLKVILRVFFRLPCYGSRSVNIYGNTEPGNLL